MKVSACYLRAMGIHGRILSRGGGRARGGEEGAAAGIRESCRFYPAMLLVGDDRTVHWGAFLKTKSMGVDDQLHAGVRGRW